MVSSDGLPGEPPKPDTSQFPNELRSHLGEMRGFFCPYCIKYCLDKRKPELDPESTSAKRKPPLLYFDAPDVSFTTIFFLNTHGLKLIFLYLFSYSFPKSSTPVDVQPSVPYTAVLICFRRTTAGTLRTSKGPQQRTIFDDYHHPIRSTESR